MGLEVATMSDTKPVCALEGCDSLISVTSGQARRYCCAVHRKIARKHRREPGRASAAEPVSHQPGWSSAAPATADRAWPAPSGEADVELGPPTTPTPLAASSAGAPASASSSAEPPYR